MKIFQLGVCKANDDLTEIIKDKNLTQKIESK